MVVSNCVKIICSLKYIMLNRYFKGENQVQGQAADRRAAAQGGGGPLQQDHPLRKDTARHTTDAGGADVPTADLSMGSGGWTRYDLTQTVVFYRSH